MSAYSCKKKTYKCTAGEQFRLANSKEYFVLFFEECFLLFFLLLFLCLFCVVVVVVLSFCFVLFVCLFCFVLLLFAAFDNVLLCFPNACEKALPKCMNTCNSSGGFDQMQIWL